MKYTNQYLWHFLELSLKFSDSIQKKKDIWRIQFTIYLQSVFVFSELWAIDLRGSEENFEKVLV